MPGTFEIQLAEMYRGIPIVEVRCKEPTLLTEESDLEMALALLEQPYLSFAVVVDYRNLSHASTYGPEEEARTRRKDPFVRLGERLMAFVRYHAASITSLVHSMRADMMLRHARSFTFAPDLDSAVRTARRSIDRSQVPTT